MAIIVQDSFTRANNTTSLGTAETGQVWTPIEGTWGITNNQAIVTTEDSMAFVETGVSDCIISIKLANQIEGRGIAFRQASGTASNAFQLQIENTLIAIYQRPAWSTVASTGNFQVPTSGSILKIVLQGTSIKVYLNNTLIIDTTSSYNLKATRHGMGTWRAGAICDDFLVEDFTVATPPIVNVVSASRTKLSSITGMNQSVIKVTFDKNVTQYVARLNGVSYDTGTLVHSGGAVSAGVQADVIIDWNELASEGNNKINIYGYANGVWSTL